MRTEEGDGDDHIRGLQDSQSPLSPRHAFQRRCTRGALGDLSKTSEKIQPDSFSGFNKHLQFKKSPAASSSIFMTDDRLFESAGGCMPSDKFESAVNKKITTSFEQDNEE